MRLMLISVACLLLFATCRKSGGGRCIPESFEFSFEKDKRIDTSKYPGPFSLNEGYLYTVNSGANLAFRYRHNFRDCPEIADDEGFMEIVFEVPAGSTSFHFEDSAALKAAKVMTRHVCECIPGAYFFKKGVVEGTRVDNNSWSVNVSLQAPNSTTTYVFNSRFRLN